MMGNLDAKQPRLVLHNFLSPEECRELEFIHKSCSTVGYRPNVFSTTLSHLIATNSPHLVMPFVPVRERLKERVEEVFGCEYELCIEFTGLISWCKGASIGWHSDDNRSYLKQRDFTAVCYLNSYGKDFNGGLFHFQDGEPANFGPMVGDVIMYTADSRNIHSVDEVMDGERLTLTLWFSRDASHDEDSKLVSLLSQWQSHSSSMSLDSCLPLPASSNMYWFSADQAAPQESGFDIRLARMQVLGIDIYCPQDNSFSLDKSEILMQPLQIAKGEELLTQKFVNILHALQIVQFYDWKESELKFSQLEQKAQTTSKLSQPQLEQVGALKSIFLEDLQLVEAVFGCSTIQDNERYSLGWTTFSTAVSVWEEYTCTLLKELLSSLPHWIAYKFIHRVQSD